MGVMAKTTTSLDHEAEDFRWRGVATGEPLGGPVIKPAGRELGRQDHQAEENEQGRKIDGRENIRPGDRSARIERQGAQKCDASTIQP
jgi:hypothetical protein